MPRCEDYIEHISAAIDGELSPQQRAQLDAHLAQCPACRALLEELTALHAGLGALPLAAPPQSLHENIMAAVGGGHVTPFPAKKPLYWKKWLSSAAVLALIVAAGWGWRAGSIGGAGSAAPTEPEAEQVAGQNMDAAVPETAPAGGEAPAAGPQAAESRAKAAEPAPAVFVDNAIPAESGSCGSAPETYTEPAAAQSKAAAPSEAPADVAPAAVEKRSGPAAPRLFSVQGTVASGGTADGETADAGESADPGESGLALLTATPPVTAEEAVNALANYIYEFVGDVELLSTPESDPVAYAVDSPTGVSGTITLTGEDEALFFLEYRDSEGGEALRYTVDKADASVTWLGELPED